MEIGMGPARYRDLNSDIPACYTGGHEPILFSVWKIYSITCREYVVKMVQYLKFCFVHKLHPSGNFKIYLNLLNFYLQHLLPNK